MNFVHKLVSTLALSLLALGLSSTVASAQTARGTFTLTHDVRWQNASVPAGEYQFSLESRGPSELMTLRQRDGAHASFMLLVGSASPSAGASLDRLVLVSRGGKSYVRTLELPYYGIALHFTVPAEGTELALAGEHTEPTRTR